jgi:hypothetical protein
LARAFEQFNRGKPHWRQVRPFNFLLVAHSGALDRGELTNRFLLVARHERDRSKWTRLRWVNVHDPQRTYSIRTGRPHNTPGRTVVVVNTYRDVLADYRTHPEPKALGPDGKPCDKQTVGLLGRRHITPIMPLRHRGKEGQWIDQREAGVADLDTIHTEYHEPGQDTLWQLVVGALRGLLVEQTAASAGVSERTVERVRSGASISKTARAKLTAHTIAHARSQLRAAGTHRPHDHQGLLAAYLNQQTRRDPTPRVCACGCGQPVPGGGRRGRPRKYIDEAHRKRVQRSSR